MGQEKENKYLDYRGQFATDGKKSGDQYWSKVDDRSAITKDYNDYYGYPYSVTGYEDTSSYPERSVLKYSSRNGVNRQVINNYSGDTGSHQNAPEVPASSSDTADVASKGKYLHNATDGNSVQYKVLQDRYNGVPGGVQGKTYLSQDYAQGGSLKNYLDYFHPTKYMEGGGWFDSLKNSKLGQVASTVADSALDFVPGVGTYRAVKNAVADPTWQNIGSAALSGVGDLMTFVPGVGWAAKAAATGLSKVAKAGKVVNAANNVANTMQAVNTANKTLNKGINMFNTANNATNMITNTYNSVQG